MSLFQVKSFQKPLFSLLTLCALSPLEGFAHDAPISQEIDISHEELRLSTDKETAFGIFVIVNKSGEDRLLESISAPVCEDISANHVDQEPINNQTPSQKDIFHRLVIPQHATLVFPEGGYHFVCHHIKPEVKINDKVNFIFHFDNNQNMKEEFLVTPPQPELEQDEE